MYKIDLSNPINIHFIGIGGISMSAIAEFFYKKGFTITGSDERKSHLTEHLETLGITVYYGNRASNISSDTQLVVYTAAVRKDNPELIAAQAASLPLLTRAELLGQITLFYSDSICISGTHGKSTTTSMLSLALENAGFDPTIFNGAVLENFNSNFKLGNSSHLVAEACEYTNSFLNFYPKNAIILNIEEDHLDFFKDLDDIRASFRRFGELLPSDGTLVVSGDIKDYSKLFDGIDAKLVSFGISTDGGYDRYDYCASNISYSESGFGSFDFYAHGSFKHRFELSVPGIHNISNATAVLALADSIDADLSLCQKGLLDFHGAKRRFETKGSIGGFTIIDDYAHHPSEITATLKTARECFDKNIWCVFQPHTYTRTKAFLKEFAEALTLADHIILTDIYAARENNPGDISSLDLLRLLSEKGKDVHHFSGFGEIEDFILEKCTPDDMLITMGAGDVLIIGERLLGL